QLQLIGVRQPAVGEPEVLVEPLRIHRERVAFPLGHGASVVDRVVVVAADLALMAAAVHVEDAVVVVAAADQLEDSLPLLVLPALHAAPLLEYTPRGRR